jgi:hypothetical protein
MFNKLAEGSHKIGLKLLASPLLLSVKVNNKGLTVFSLARNAERSGTKHRVKLPIHLVVCVGEINWALK